MILNHHSIARREGSEQKSVPKLANKICLNYFYEYSLSSFMFLFLLLLQKTWAIRAYVVLLLPVTKQPRLNKTRPLRAPWLPDGRAKPEWCALPP